MFLATTFGVSDATLGTALAVAWLGTLGWLGHQYRRGSVSRSKLFSVSTMALLWLAWSLLQIANGTSGGVETLVELLAVGVFVAAIVAAIQWRRS
ncbi:hypothetical protein [Natronoarchaeum rubrum]|uniref:hypothetical protein n=1 Tax=Natronoarchaeum rubrum TaxID=755311 RepID=UPI002112FD62|nr:hypothetical protein [Natronoarchaeum rubrum]